MFGFNHYYELLKEPSIYSTKIHGKTKSASKSKKSKKRSRLHVKF